MLKTFINNKSYSSSGLLKVSLPDLLAMNPTITEVTNVTLIATVSASTATRANFYIMPESTIPANCTTCRYVTQSSLATTAQTFNLNVTEIFNTNRDAGKDYIYLRVSPLSNTNVSITHIKLEITANCDVETNAVTYETFSKAYTAIEAGNMGKANVNLRDGNLSFGLSSMQFGGGSTSFNLSHVYRGVHCNSDEYYTSFHTKHGFGWKTNFHQYLVGSDEHAVYIDGQGNKHTFKKSNGKVYDDGGLGLTITSAGYCKKVYDDLGNTMHFARSGQLCRIDTALKKSYFIHYNNNDDIDYIENGDYKAQFTYNNNLLKKIAYIKISDNSEIENIQFEYTSNQLTKITKHVGSNSKIKAQFAYENGKLTKIYGGDYTYLQIDYSNSKVNKVSTYSSGNNRLSYSSFNYNHSYGTAITNEAGVTYAYKIKANGELEKIYDMQSDSYGIQIHPTSNDKIETTTYLNNIKLDQVTSVTDTSTSTTVTFSSTGNFLTVDDVKASLYSLFKNNSTKLDFFYNNKRDRICNIPVSSCKINTDTTFSSNILSHKTFLYDDKGYSTVYIETTETCEQAGFKNTSTYYTTGSPKVELTTQYKITDYTTGQVKEESVNGIVTTYSYDQFGNQTSVSKRPSNSYSNVLTSSAHYSSDGAHKEYDTDERGYQRSYTYNTPTNTIKTLKNPQNNTTSFGYDDYNENLKTVSFNGQYQHQITTNDYGYTTQISNNGTTYYFDYSPAGDLISVKAGNDSSKTTLYSCTYNYAASNKYEEKTTGGTPEKITYDKYGNIYTIESDGKSATFTYDSSSSQAKLNEINDGFANAVTEFSTSSDGGQLFERTGNDDFRLKWKKEEKTKDKTLYTIYTMSNSIDEVAYKKIIYDANGAQKSGIQIVSSYANDTSPFTCTYDEQDTLNRIKKKSYSTPSGSSSVEYTYLTSGSNSTSYVSSEINSFYGTNYSKNETREYQYDNLGNLTNIKIRANNSEKNIKYHYDSFGRITREDNGPLNLTYTYTYDENANLKSRKRYSHNDTTSLKEPMAYEYDENFKDLLKKHDGYDISYTNGYPSSYKGNTLEWQRGYLTKYTYPSGNTTGSIYYEYDAFGRKIRKHYGTGTGSIATAFTYFYYDGDRLIGKDRYANNAPVLYVRYLYDNEGLCGIKARRSSSATFNYYKVTRDAFGNIISLDSNNKNYMSITYDAFGKPTYDDVLLDGINFNADEILPFMYKGYYFDTELGWYEIGSRLYDPETGRFISPEAPTNLRPTMLGGMSPYTYCFNNHVSNMVTNLKSKSKEKDNSSTKLYDISPLVEQLKPMTAALMAYSTFLERIDDSYYALLHESDLICDLKPSYISKFNKISKGLTLFSVGLDFLDNYSQGKSGIYILSYAALTLVSAWLINELVSGSIILLTTLIGGPAAFMFAAIFSILASYAVNDLITNLSAWFESLFQI